MKKYTFYSLIFILCFFPSIYAQETQVEEVIFLGSWTVYGDWQESDDCSCGSSSSHQIANDWSLSGEFGLNLGFFTINFGLNPPSAAHTITCTSTATQHMRAYYCSKNPQHKFHEKYYTIIEYILIGPYYAHPIVKYDLYMSTQREVQYCPQKPWTHICHQCEKDKNGNNICVHEPAVCDHGKDKSGNPIPCPYPKIDPPQKMSNEGSEPQCTLNP